MNAKRKFLFALAVVLALSAFAALGYAQSNQTDATLQFVGKIDAVNANSVMVNGHEIFLDNAAINTDLKVGASVIVTGNLTSDNHIEAASVDVADENYLLPDELRITGVLESSADSRFNLGGSLIDTGSVSTGAALNTGAVVRVFAGTDSLGAWSARRVQLLDSTKANASANADFAADMSLFQQGRYQVVGTLDAVTEDSITVSGLTINTTGADIKGGLVLGAVANVWLSNADDQVRATAVTNADVEANANPDAFIDLSSDSSLESSTDASASANVNTDVNANAGMSDADASANATVDVNANVNTDTSANANNNSSSSTDTSASGNASVGVDIDLGGGVSISLGGG